MKTGLSSARFAVKALGWAAFGYVRGDAQAAALYLKEASNHDAVFDLPAAALWESLAVNYPWANVIYTQRDTNEWLDSIEDWIIHCPFVTPAERMFAAKVYGSPTFTRVGYREAKEKHDSHVMEWGRRNPERFLLLDVIGGDGWEKLCPFIGEPVPDLPFPRVRPGAHRGTWETAGVDPFGDEGEVWR